MTMDCPPLTITFLGTGTSSGVPMIACPCAVCRSEDPKDKRLRSSILVESATTRLVVDTGPDFRYQMLRAGVKQLDAVLFTHPHKDHVAGLDDVRAFNFFSGKAMDVYCNELTEAVILREFPYAFADHKYPGVPELNLQTIDLTPFFIGDIPVQPILVWHLKMPVFGFRFGDFTYITDANRIDESERLKIAGSTHLVVNALRKEPHISHFTQDEAVILSLEMGVEVAYFTHISHQLGLHAKVSSSLPEPCRLAYDGLQIQIAAVSSM
jgi:phosphoribosyl 1,2-cyclic phosphate phosphodiesterase